MDKTEGMDACNFDQKARKFVQSALGEHVQSFLRKAEGSSPKNFLKEVAKYEGVP